MKVFNKLFGLSLIALMAFGVISCVEDDALEIQKLNKYSEEYFQGIRDWKAKDHCLSYVYYAAYAPVEGVEGYKDPASWGERIRGLPDSLDIVNLWMGNPTNDPNSDDYAPIAYEDMKYCQKNLGTRFVMHADATASVRTVDGVTFDFTSNTSATVVEYAHALVDYVLKCELDGIDIDYEPNWSTWTSYIATLVQTIGETFGPMGTMPDKLLIVDYYNTTSNLNRVADYLSYVVCQAYGSSSDSSLNSSYNSVSSWCDPGKWICIETFGDYYANGGASFTDSSGNHMYSLEGMARWNPSRGNKGGFGAYYVDRDYYSSTGIPYYNLRRCIQIANPTTDEEEVEEEEGN